MNLALAAIACGAGACVLALSSHQWAGSEWLFGAGFLIAFAGIVWAAVGPQAPGDGWYALLLAVVGGGIVVTRLVRFGTLLGTDTAFELQAVQNLHTTGMLDVTSGAAGTQSQFPGVAMLVEFVAAGAGLDTWPYAFELVLVWLDALLPLVVLVVMRHVVGSRPARLTSALLIVSLPNVGLSWFMTRENLAIVSFCLAFYALWAVARRADGPRHFVIFVAACMAITITHYTVGVMLVIGLLSLAFYQTVVGQVSAGSGRAWTLMAMLALFIAVVWDFFIAADFGRMTLMAFLAKVNAGNTAATTVYAGGEHAAHAFFLRLVDLRLLFYAAWAVGMAMLFSRRWPGLRLERASAFLGGSIFMLGVGAALGLSRVLGLNADRIFRYSFVFQIPVIAGSFLRAIRPTVLAVAVLSVVVVLPSLGALTNALMFGNDVAARDTAESAITVERAPLAQAVTISMLTPPRTALITEYVYGPQVVVLGRFPNPYLGFASPTTLSSESLPHAVLVLPEAFFVSGRYVQYESGGSPVLRNDMATEAAEIDRDSVRAYDGGELVGVVRQS